MRKARFASETRDRVQYGVRKTDIRIGISGWRYPGCETARSVCSTLNERRFATTFKSDSAGLAQVFSQPLMKMLLMSLLVLVVGPVWALDDTPPNREQEAARYLQVTPPKEMMSDMAEQMAKNMPQDQRDAFKALLMKHLDMNALTKAIKDAMVKNFTADELKALADFYGSPVGKSAMKKFGTYMADVMPSVQAEVMKAQAAANGEKK